MWNLNIGVLGHVDSGKTSLCRALSATASTAAFDKSPQSQERGITLDLGFSSRILTPESDILCAPYLATLYAASHQEERSPDSREASVTEKHNEGSEGTLCCTFVDCPGHATLIRTIVGGAQIIDVMILVIDATKGVQAQTAECLVIGEILARPLVVVINKIDSLDRLSAEKASEVAPGDDTNQKRLESPAEDGKRRLVPLDKLRKKLVAMFSKTRWPQVEIIEVSAAAPYHSESIDSSKSGTEGNTCDRSERGVEMAVGASPNTRPINIEQILPAVLRCAPLQELLHSRWIRVEKNNQEYEGGSLPSFVLSLTSKENFIMLADHCFAVRGHGTVFTGTVLQGRVEIGDPVWLPTLQVQKKVKGLQVFKKQVMCARMGDRVGLCVTQLDPSSFERGILCSSSGCSNGCGRGDLIGFGAAAEGNGSINSIKHSKTAKEIPKEKEPAKINDTAGSFMGTKSCPGSLLTPVLLSLPVLTKVFIARVHRIRFHRFPCDTLTKFHIILGHTTVMGTFRYFSRPSKSHGLRHGNEISLGDEGGKPSLQTSSVAREDGDGFIQKEEVSALSLSSFDLHEESVAEEELSEDATLQFASTSLSQDRGDHLNDTVSVRAGKLLPPCPTSKEYYAVVLLDEPVPASVNGTFVGMRLDIQREGVCRIAITGCIRYIYPYSSSSTTNAHLSACNSSSLESVPEYSWRALPVYRYKTRKLQICRVLDDRTCIADGVIHLVSAQTGTEKDSHLRHAEAQKFVGVPVYFVPFHAVHCDPSGTRMSERTNEQNEELMPVKRSSSVCGTIHSTFGKSGKVRLEFSKPIFSPSENCGKRRKGNKVKEESEKNEEAQANMSRKTISKEENLVTSSSQPWIFIEDGEIVLEIRKAPFALHYDSLKNIRNQ